MFIRKWRYLQNLENARSEGRQEGLHEANKRKFAYATCLEEVNKALQDKLAVAEATIERLRQESVPEHHEDDSSSDEIKDCCPEVSGISDSLENCPAVQGFCDEESFF